MSRCRWTGAAEQVAQDARVEAIRQESAAKAAADRADRLQSELDQLRAGGKKESDHS